MLNTKLWSGVLIMGLLIGGTVHAAAPFQARMKDSTRTKDLLDTLLRQKQSIRQQEITVVLVSGNITGEIFSRLDHFLVLKTETKRMSTKTGERVTRYHYINLDHILAISVEAYGT